jgi:hypothetical protein
MGKQATLAEYLRALRVERGGPTLRRIASEVSFSHKTAQEMLNGSQVGKWDTVQELVLHLGGDPEVARELWEAAKEQLALDRAAKLEANHLRRLKTAEETNRLLALLVDRFDELLERLPKA